MDPCLVVRCRVALLEEGRGGTERERERESETGRDAEANTQIKNIRKTFKI